MKRMLFGLGLLLSGVIGFVGWCIAATGMVEPGARSNIWGCLEGSEWIVLLIFAAMAVAGLVIATVEYMGGTAKCADIIKNRIKADTNETEQLKADCQAEERMYTNINLSEKAEEMYNSKKLSDVNNYQCQSCGYVQNKAIRRCLKCGQLIENTETDNSNFTHFR